MAQAHDFINELPLRYETRLEENGTNLSGGQRQAVTLLMAAMKKPKLLLLDEHTAALDPKTAKKVLEITEEIVAKDNLMTIMITHNMADAIRVGNRLIMMHEGRIIYDVKGEEKKNLHPFVVLFLNSIFAKEIKDESNDPTGTYPRAPSRAT